MKKILTASVIALAVATTASAQSLANHDWTGFYMGGTVGAGVGNTNWNTIYGTYEGGPSDVNVKDVLNVDTLGGAIGLTVGYNWMTAPNFLVGVEGELGFTSLGGSGTCLGDNSYYTAACSSDINALAAASLRAGYVADRTMIYGKIGVAAARFKYTVGDFNFTSPPYDPVSKTRTGMLIGVGVEHALNDTVSIKGELDYLNFGKNRVDFTAGCGVGGSYTGCYATDFGTDISNTAVLMTIGVNIKLK